VKIDLPPAYTRRPEWLERIWNGDDAAFLQRSDERYAYYDDIRYRKDNPLPTPEETWGLLKTYRHTRYETLRFGQHRFRYYLSSYVQRNLHEFDVRLMGDLYRRPIPGPDRWAYLRDTLMEEAVASSQVEGAATTTEVAREMLRTGRQPRNESERMIVNNLMAIRHVSDRASDPLDLPFILELHRVMTAHTEAERHAGRFREGAVFVTDRVDGEIAHTPPPPGEVEPFMEEVCRFINREEPFIHPIIKASILHFLIGYVHPFGDGNGRTARALFYWFLLKKGYALVSDLSISRVILESRTQYDKAFLKTERDENDLNHFLHYAIKNLRVAFEKLTRYRDRKREERRRASALAFDLLDKGLNKRQADLMAFLSYRDPTSITLKEYAEKHDVVRQTASKDLGELVRLGLLALDRSGKPYRYTMTDRKAIDAFLGR
jgi:Fic family protein